MKTSSKPRRRPARSGFTLVEILTVIVIIGILAGIAIPAVTSALRTAREAAIRLEIDVLGQALDAYQLKYGEYPPDFSDWTQVERHFRKAFPSIDDNELRILAQLTYLQNPASNYGRVGSSMMAPDPDPRGRAAFEFHPHSLDRAEALVFCLGGFSSDSKRPFTGQGGPLTLIPSSTNPLTYLNYQYNTERDNAFFDFDASQLSIRQFNIPSDASSATDPLNINFAYTYSNDELVGQNLASWSMATSHSTAAAAGIPCHADPFPTYRIGGTALPVVYFNSKRYDATFGVDTPGLFGPGHYLNVYLPPAATPSEGVARPYVTEVVDTTPPTTFAGTTVPGVVLEFAEADGFQLISGGLDDSYGGIFNPVMGGVGAGGAVYAYPSGKAYNILGLPSSGVSISAKDKYADDDIFRSDFGNSSAPYLNLQPQLDNITNFSTRTLESDLE